MLHDKLEQEPAVPAERPHHGQAQELAMVEDAEEEEQEEEQILQAGSGEPESR